MEKLTSSISPEHKQLYDLLLNIDQQHLFQDWPDGDEEKEKKEEFFEQVAHLEKVLPGGIQAYYEMAKVLLKESHDGVNPFEGYTPSVPEGETIQFEDDDKFETLEEAGLQEFQYTAVVLVAGGLGERLGYSGIKLELPVDIVTEMCYLEFYCRWIQAIETKLNLAPGTVPFVIMTSDDTHTKTVALLEANTYFGLPEGQLTIVKQETVPALLDNAAHFAPSEGNPFHLQTKPQGHGVVHTLLHQAGLAAQWKAAGKRWIAFIQDTNTPNFRCLLPTLGVSAARNLAANSVATVYKPGEAIGAICHLTHPSKRTLTINVEYNQLGPLLSAVGQADTPDSNGYSLYPGNINLLVFAVGPYADALETSGGQVPNFVNPKYADSTKSAFKKPTRLECMMQDFPRLLPEDCPVGFTRFDLRQLCMAPCKNSVADGISKQQSGLFPDTAASAEHNYFMVQGRYLEKVGVTVDHFASPPVFSGITVEEYPHLAVLPSFAVTRGELRHRFKAGDCRISANSTLVLRGDITFEQLDLDGTLVIQACPGAKVVVKRMGVRNDGWPYLPLSDPDAPEYLRIRGYQIARRGQRVLHFDEPGDYVVDEPI